jgi:hypothetical protein
MDTDPDPEQRALDADPNHQTLIFFEQKLTLFLFHALSLILLVLSSGEGPGYRRLPALQTVVDIGSLPFGVLPTFRRPREFFHSLNVVLYKEWGRHKFAEDE